MCKTCATRNHTASHALRRHAQRLCLLFPSWRGNRVHVLPALQVLQAEGRFAAAVLPYKGGEFEAVAALPEQEGRQVSGNRPHTSAFYEGQLRAVSRPRRSRAPTEMLA